MTGDPVILSVCGGWNEFITVLPQLDMVVAHKTDIEQVSPHGPGQRRRAINSAEYGSILRMLIAAKAPTVPGV